MAIYEGARQRTIVLPRIPRAELQRRTVDAPALPRRRIRSAVRARRGTSRIGLLLGVIVVAFVCAFFSLSQSVRVSELRYEADRLRAQQEDLRDRAMDLRNDLNRLAKAPAIRKLAIDAGLAPLSEPLVIPAR
jgi:cell division protein FtsL